jgi:hypothetical protein
MAFTATQQESIRQYLGFSAGWRDHHHKLESMLGLVGDGAERQATVEAILTELAAVDAALASSGASAAARGALKKVDEIEWHPITADDSGSTVTAKERGQILIHRLARRFGFRPGEYDAGYFDGVTSISFEVCG